MNVRGWLIVGPVFGTSLPPEADMGGVFGLLPPAVDYEVGQWLSWFPHGYSAPMAAVCVEVPIG
jgi:hypothetical protein